MICRLTPSTSLRPVDIVDFMNDEEFVRAAGVLSSDLGLRILRVFSDKDWRIASEVSSHLDIHTSTASKYLAHMYKSGFLEKRVRKTGRRSTYEYHLKNSRIQLELDICPSREIGTLDAWRKCLTAFYQLIVHGIRMGFLEFADEAEKLIEKLKTETGVESLCFYDPRCNIEVVKRLVMKRIEEGRLENSLSEAKKTSHLVFAALRSLCEERVGKIATERLFACVLSEFDQDQREAFRELGLMDAFERGYGNE